MAPQSSSPSPAEQAHEKLTRRVEAAARVMTFRGVLVRIASAGAGIVLLTLVSPADYGLLAIVRSVAATIEQGSELGMVWPMLRQPEAPTSAEYRSLGGAQLVILVVIFIGAALYPSSLAVIGVPDPRWRAWFLAVIVALLLTPLGTGARVRLERDLQYTRIAFAEVTALLVHSLFLIGFLFAGKFAVGVFVAQIVIVAYQNLFLYLCSPGPLPDWRVGRALHKVSSSSGYTAGYLGFVAREHLWPILVSGLFGLETAGAFAFAARLGKMMQFSYEGFSRVAVPAAARLICDRPALRSLAARTLTGASLIAVPASAVVVFSLPAIAVVLPQWATAVPLAQVYVACDSMAGVLSASLAPIALALYGWVAVLLEHAAPLLVGCAGFLLLRQVGSDHIESVIIAINLAAIAILFMITGAEVRPPWTRELTRMMIALATGVCVYFFGVWVSAPPVITALAASSGLSLWLWRGWLAELKRLQKATRNE